MTKADLDSWLARDEVEFTAAIADEVREHIAKIQASGEDFYGYAILPGETYEVSDLVAAHNGETDLDSDKAADDYYRYSVDEWQHHERGVFPKSNKLLDEQNAHFKSLHVKANPEGFSMDEQQLAHVAKLHDATLSALLRLRGEGLFDEHDYLIIWIPDAASRIMYESAKQLNSASVYDAFMSEFG